MDGVTLVQSGYLMRSMVTTPVPREKSIPVRRILPRKTRKFKTRKNVKAKINIQMNK